MDGVDDGMRKTAGWMEWNTRRDGVNWMVNGTGVYVKHEVDCFVELSRMSRALEQSSDELVQSSEEA